MYSSDPSLAMFRITLEFLLVIVCGGYVIHAVDEEQMGSVANNVSDISVQSIARDTYNLSRSENITSGNTSSNENGPDLNNSTGQWSDSSSTLMSTGRGKETNETYDTESSGTTISYTSENSQSSSSKIDSAVEVGNGTELVALGDIQKAGLQKAGDEDEAIEVETEVPLDFAEITREMDLIKTGNFSVESVEKGDDSLSSLVPAIVKTLESDDNVNSIEVAPEIILDSPRKVSASPKSATKKRSLNSTDSPAFNDDTTLIPSQYSDVRYSVSQSVFPSSNLNAFGTTVKSKPNSNGFEELPTPLPLEIQSNDDSMTAISSARPLSVNPEMSISNPEKEGTYNLRLRPSVAAIDSTPNINLESSANTIGMRGSTGDSETVTLPIKEDNFKTINASGYTIHDGSKPSDTEYSPMSINRILSHESDDIIYAGYAEDEPLGVTFDPDGMKNDFSQDPDSIIFSVPPKDPFKISTNTVDDPAYETTHNLKLNDSEDKNLERENYPEHGKESIGLLDPEVLPHDAPEAEFANIQAENTSKVLNHVSIESNHTQSFVPPETVYGKSVTTPNDAEENMQDTPREKADESSDTNSFQSFVTTDTKTNPKEGYSVDSTSKSSSDTRFPTVVTAISKDGSSSDFMPHQTEQSVIRPVKVQSPAAESASTSVPSGLSFPQSDEFSTVLSPSMIKSDHSSSANVDHSDPDTSSPVILPNPAPSITEKLDESLELPTMVMQPELSPSTLGTDEVPMYDNGTLNRNSTIAGVAIKTSVSVSLPLSKNTNATEYPQKSPEFDSHQNTSMPSITNVPTSLPPTSMSNNDSNASPLDTITSTDNPSASTGFKILRPGIKIPGVGEGPRTRKPFTPSYKRPPTTAGPPVSAFKKNRIRANSITSSTTARAIPQFSTIRIHYASRMPGLRPDGEMMVSVEPITTTVPPPTTTEEPISEIPFTDQTYQPSLPNEDDVTLVKVGGGIVLEKGLRWTDQLGNRHSPEYKDKATQIHLHLERLFRSSPIASRLWRIEIDGFNGTKNSRSVEVDFILYLIKSADKIALEHLVTVFHEKLSANNTFARYRVDPNRTAFEMLQEEPLHKPTLSPDEQPEPPVPQWAIAVIVISAASLIFIVLFAAVTMYGRHHMRRRYGNKLSEDELDRSSGDWESKMTAAYENMAADTIYDAEDLHGDNYKKSYIVD